MMTTETPVTSEEIRLSRVAGLVLGQWRLIVRVVLGALVVALAFYLLRPAQYTAVTTLIPAQTGGSDLSLLAAQFDLPIPLRSQEADPSRLLGTFAKSRLLADSMVQRAAAAGFTEGQAIRKVLNKKTGFRSNADRSIVIVVTDRSPTRAAFIANEFPGLLNTITTQTAEQVTELKLQNLSQQLAGALARLHESEQRLVEFRRTGAAPAFEAQAEQTVVAAGALQRNVMEQELKIAQMRRSMTPDNPELVAAQAELATLRQQLSRLTAERPSGSGLYVPMRSAPGLKATELRMQREFERDQQIYAALAGAVAQTQIDMNNDLPIVSVLDDAVVPSTPSGISLPTLLALAAVLGVMLALAAIVWHALWQRVQRDPESRGLVNAWTDLKHNLWRPFTKPKVGQAT